MPAWHHYVAVPAGLLEYKMKLHKNAAVWFHLFKNQNPVSLSPLLVCAFFPSVRDTIGWCCGTSTLVLIHLRRMWFSRTSPARSPNK